VRDVVASARTEGKRSVLIRVKKGENTRFVALPLSRG
jgi:serine protease Do